MNSTTDKISPLDSQHWDMVIEPRRNLLDLRLGDLWRARDLVLLFVWRDFVSYYKQTILGPLWYLIQPILTTVVFTFIFGSVAKLPTGGLPQFLFYLSGTVVWSYFAACITKTADTFITNTQLFGKVYFPRLAVPLSILISNLISFAIQFALLLAFMGYFALRGSLLHPNWWILLTPLLILMMAGLGLGFGIIISSLTTKYRDLRFLVTFGVTLLMYATPAILPLSSFPQRFQWIILVNPLTPIMETFRYAFLGGGGTVNLPDLAYSFGFMLVVVILGTVIFNRVEATFMDTV